MSDQKIRVRTTVILEQLVDLDSYGGMTAQEAVAYESKGRDLGDRLMEFAEATECATFVDEVENLSTDGRTTLLGHISTVATAEHVGAAAASAETVEGA